VTYLLYPVKVEVLSSVARTVLPKYFGTWNQF